MKINNRIESGQEKLTAFVRSLLERNKVPEDQWGAEQSRLEDMIMEKIFRETLETLPDEDLDELEKALKENEEFPMDKWNSILFEEGIRPESIVGKVFREVEREYLGTENVESEETLIEEAEEGE